MKEAEEEITEEMLMDKIETYINSIKDDPSIPYFILSGSGPGLYYSIGDRTMVCIQKGTEVIPIDKYDDIYEGKKVVFIGN